MHGLSETSRKAAQDSLAYSKQRCRDGLSGFPEGIPEVWSGTAVCYFPVKVDFADSTHALLERR